MDEPSLAVRLRTTMSSFTPAEKKIARAILASYPFSGLDSISNLADAAGVSSPSVVRFARALGFAGYREFQVALKAEIRAREESNLSQAEAGRRGSGPLFKAAQAAYQEGIERTFDSVIDDELDQVVNSLSDSRKNVCLVGATYTGYIADILLAQLIPTRPRVQRLSDNPLVATGQLVDLKRGDVLVAFDMRRYESSITEIVKIAKEFGLTVIVFTDLWMSPATAHADHVLTAEVRAAGPSDTLVPMLALVEAVSEMVVAELGDSGLKRLSRIDPNRSRLTSEH